LRSAGGAAAVGDDFFELRLHLRDAFGLGGGEILGFAEVVVEVVELDGLALIAAFAPAA
jgi:hypothetical protein